MRPGDQVGAAAAVSWIAVSGAEPHGPTLRQNALFRSIRTAYANVRPIVAGISARLAILVRQPIAIRGPDWAEVEMAALASDLVSPAAHNVAGPDLVAGWTGEMPGHAL